MFLFKLKRLTDSTLWLAGGSAFLLGVVVLLIDPLLLAVIICSSIFIIALPKRPETLILAIIFFTSTFLGENYIPRLPIGIGHLYITDALLLVLFGLIVYHIIVPPQLGIIKTPLDWPLILFYTVALFSTLIAIHQSVVDTKRGLTAIRYVSFYLTFFVVTNLVNEKRQIVFLIHGISFLAILVAVAMIVQYFLGEAIPFLSGRVEKLVTHGKVYSDITRILPPGRTIILTAFFLIFSNLVLNELKENTIFKIIQLGLLGVAIILTFNRTYWVSGCLGISILFILAKANSKKKILLFIFATSIFITLFSAIAINYPEWKGSRLADAALERVVTIISAKTYQSDYQESTFRWRDFEYDFAVKQIKKNPVIGLGLGAYYRPFVEGIDWQDSQGREYIHNGHLWIILKTGFLGYFFFMWLSIAFMVRCFRYRKNAIIPGLKGQTLGFFLTYLCILIGSVTDPMFMQWEWIPVIGIMMGINEMIIRNNVEEKRNEKS